MLGQDQKSVEALGATVSVMRIGRTQGVQFSMASSFEERFNVFISVLDCRQSDWAAWRSGAPRGAAPSVHVRVKVIGSSLTSN